MKTVITCSLLTILGSRSTFILIALALSAFALGQTAQAVSPPPDGGYAGGNTAEGQNALLNLTTGGFNTAVGFLSLRSDTTGQFTVRNRSPAISGLPARRQVKRANPANAVTQSIPCGLSWASHQ